MTKAMWKGFGEGFHDALLLLFREWRRTYVPGLLGAGQKMSPEAQMKCFLLMVRLRTYELMEEISCQG
jgi:hypothetical protein